MISAPEASWASFMTSIDEYLPVPTIRREENSLPPRTRFVSFMALPPTHRSHDFHLVARVEPRRRVGALGCDLAVYRDGRVLARDAQVRQQRLHADALRDLALFAVHRDLHHRFASRRASPSLRGRRSARTATSKPRLAARVAEPPRPPLSSHCHIQASPRGARRRASAAAAQLALPHKTKRPRPVGCGRTIIRAPCSL